MASDDSTADDSVFHRQLWFSQALITFIEIVAFLYLIGYILDFIDSVDEYFLHRPYTEGIFNNFNFAIRLFGFLWLEGVDLIVGMLVFAGVGIYLTKPFFHMRISINNNFPGKRLATACYLACGIVFGCLAALISTYDEKGEFDISFLVLLILVLGCWLATGFYAFIRYGVLAALAGVVFLGISAPDEQSSSALYMTTLAEFTGGPVSPMFLLDKPTDDGRLLHKTQAARWVNVARRSAIGAIRGSLRGAVISPLRGGIKGLASSTNRGAKRIIKMMKQLTQMASDWIKGKLFPRSRGKTTPA